MKIFTLALVGVLMTAAVVMGHPGTCVLGVCQPAPVIVQPAPILVQPAPVLVQPCRPACRPVLNLLNHMAVHRAARIEARIARRSPCCLVPVCGTSCQK